LLGWGYTDRNGHRNAEHYPRQFDLAHVAVGANLTARVEVEWILSVRGNDLGSRVFAVSFVGHLFVVLLGVLNSGLLLFMVVVVVVVVVVVMVVVTGPVVRTEVGSKDVG
jgi:hypothetical protein